MSYSTTDLKTGNIEQGQDSWTWGHLFTESLC